MILQWITIEQGKEAAMEKYEEKENRKRRNEEKKASTSSKKICSQGGAKNFLIFKLFDLILDLIHNN